MAVIDIAIQPEGRTRVWFDCRNAKPRPGDEKRIQRAVSHALANLNLGGTVAAELTAFRPRRIATPAVPSLGSMILLQVCDQGFEIGFQLPRQTSRL